MIIGKPNVGKSTIINKLVKTKISIVSKKPHTTQDNILGIKNLGSRHQSIYIDTPGISYKHVYNNQNKNFRNIIALFYDIQFIFLVLDKTNWTDEDEYILKIIKKYQKPVFAIINKIDQIKTKQHLLPYILHLSNKHMFQEIIPVSGKTGENIYILSKTIKKELPVVLQHPFPAQLKTNMNIKKIISEIIREKFILYLGLELPYSIKTAVQKIVIRKTNKSYIEAKISVTNIQHKKIVIGQKGQKIKLCGLLARKEIEKFLKQSIYLSLRVIQVKKNL